jgi:hypothetical protein
MSPQNLVLNLSLVLAIALDTYANYDNPAFGKLFPILACVLGVVTLFRRAYWETFLDSLKPFGYLWATYAPLCAASFYFNWKGLQVTTTCIVGLLSLALAVIVLFGLLPEALKWLLSPPPAKPEPSLEDLSGRLGSEVSAQIERLREAERVDERIRLSEVARLRDIRHETQRLIELVRSDPAHPYDPSSNCEPTKPEEPKPKSRFDLIDEQ